MKKLCSNDICKTHIHIHDTFHTDMLYMYGDRSSDFYNREHFQLHEDNTLVVYQIGHLCRDYSRNHYFCSQLMFQQLDSSRQSTNGLYNNGHSHSENLKKMNFMETTF